MDQDFVRRPKRRLFRHFLFFSLLLNAKKLTMEAIQEITLVFLILRLFSVFFF